MSSLFNSNAPTQVASGKLTRSFWQFCLFHWSGCLTIEAAVTRVKGKRRDWRWTFLLEKIQSKNSIRVWASLYPFCWPLFAQKNKGKNTKGKKLNQVHTKSKKRHSKVGSGRWVGSVTEFLIPFFYSSPLVLEEKNVVTSASTLDW